MTDRNLSLPASLTDGLYCDESQRTNGMDGPDQSDFQQNRTSAAWCHDKIMGFGTVCEWQNPLDLRS